MNKLFDKKRDGWLIISLCVLCLLYVLPIILANRYYNDDTQRVLYHNAGWALDGRPLAELFFKILCGGQNYVFDLFPMPLLLSVVIFAFVSVMWSRKFYVADEPVVLISSFLPIAFPFFLTNLSYRFDCISIMLSIVFLMLPFLIRTESVLKKLIIDIVLILISMCFYQATVGMFAALVLFVWFLEYMDGRADNRALIIHAASMVVAAVIYKEAIASVFVDKQGWRAQANGFVTSSNPVMQVTGNFYDVILLILDYVRGAGARQVLLFAATWMLGAVVLYMNASDNRPVKKLTGVFLYCLLPVLMFVFSELPMIVLNRSYAQTWHQPELVVMMFVFSLAAVLAGKKYPRIAVAAGALIIMCLFSFSYSYGNTLRSQKEYEEYMVRRIVGDIESSGQEVEEIAVFGKMPFSPVVSNMCEIMPIMRDMIPAGIDNDGMLCGAIINHYSGDHLGFADITDEDKAYVNSAEPLYARKVYDMYINGNKVYVDFGNGE